ncbi:low affinity iron transporter-like protein [Stipitochalara longipes BDJ]|nr:low affinity iron transporter-like protein [Stipitochalara longipes BDJ]
MPNWWKNFVASFTPETSPIYAAAPTQKVHFAEEGPVRPPSPSYFPDSEKNGRRASGTNPEKRKSWPITSIKDQLQIDVTEISSPRDISSAKKSNLFDKITRAAGSSTTFFVMLAILGVWVLLGIIFGPTDTWQILLQNVSSVQVYVTDILLIRQSSNAGRSMMTTLAELQSRNKTFERLLRQLPSCSWMETHKEKPKQLLVNGRPIEEEIEESLFMVSGRQTRGQQLWTRISHAVGKSVGSVWAFFIYWIGIVVWIVLGIPVQFSNEWQLYINTITALSLTLTSVFLQNIQQQQEDNLEKSLEYALKVDAEVEYRFREITEDTKPNPIYEIPFRSLSRSERAIARFAAIMGSGLGVLISLVALIAWLAVGPILKFDDNWVLIIGTFTGLVGFIDGFVLRNIYSIDETSAALQFRALMYSDSRILEVLNIPVPVEPVKTLSLSERISLATSDMCGHRYTSVGAVLVVVGLLVAASILQWSETGQLLCNTPTMIVEGFLLLVLIQAHNFSNMERGRDFNALLKRRLLLSSYVSDLEY